MKSRFGLRFFLILIAMLACLALFAFFLFQSESTPTLATGRDARLPAETLTSPTGASTSEMQALPSDDVVIAVEEHSAEGYETARIQAEVEETVEKFSPDSSGTGEELTTVADDQSLRVAPEKPQDEPVAVLSAAGIEEPLNSDGAQIEPALDKQVPESAAGTIAKPEEPLVSSPLAGIGFDQPEPVSDAAGQGDLEHTAKSDEVAPVLDAIPNQFNGLFFALCLMLAAATVGSVVTNIILFRWRRKDGDFQVLIPEEVVRLLNQQRRDMNEFAKTMELHVDEAAKNTDQSKKYFSDLMESFSVLQSSLDQKDKELARWKSGYDVQVYKKFLSRFVKLERVLSEDIEDLRDKEPGTAKALSQIRELLVDALSECGLSEFSPKVGESIRTAFGVDENYKTSPTADPEKALTIAEVLSPGFQLSTPSGPESIANARVRVFVSA